MPRPYVADEMSRMDEKRISHNRQSNRLEGYDYSTPGAYFVTVVSYQRLPVFGEITNGELQLNQFGRIVEDCWLEIPSHFPLVKLDAYVIMPNHLHGILYNSNYDVTGPHDLIITKNESGLKPQTLGAIIGSFKSAMTKHIHHLGLTNKKIIWQRNFYEHIIRDDEDFERIADYIQLNSSAWENDQEYVLPEPFIQ